MIFSGTYMAAVIKAAEFSDSDQAHRLIFRVLQVATF
jgi:hypothetical protein